MENPFDTLGISSNASEIEVRQAYRAMARRWHPDRFAEGPERLWAEQKMVQINLAYHEALVESAGRTPGQSNEMTPEDEQLEDIKKMIDIGQLSSARQALIRVATRSAEWNYLFGAVLLRLGEYEKAVLYFGIAARKQPNNLQYRAAYASAEVIRNQKNKKRPFSGWLARVKNN